MTHSMENTGYATITGDWFFGKETTTTAVYSYGHTLSLHDTLPILLGQDPQLAAGAGRIMVILGLGQPAGMIYTATAFFLEGLKRPVPGMIAMVARSEEHTSELQSLMRSSSAVFCLKTKRPHFSQPSQPISTITCTSLSTSRT